MLLPLITAHLASGTADPLPWEICPGEGWALVGPAGAGKGRVLGRLAGLERGPTPVMYHSADGRRKTPYPDPATVGRREIVRVRFADQRALLGADSYHQARWNSFGCGDAMTVAEALSAQRIYRVSPYQVLGPEIVPPDFEQHCGRVIEALGILPLLGRKAMQLSNGERRKVMFAQALSQRPRLLLLDDPFAGLDADYRERLHQILAELVLAGTALVFSTPRIGDLGSLATHVFQMEAGRVVKLGRCGCSWLAGEEDRPAPRPRRAAPDFSPGKPTVELRNVSVRYGDTAVLRDVSWTVRQGENWAVLGPNGAGKTTLLGLLLGDNPQAYALDVRVFGKRLGRDISVRELRQRVGHVSPELHLNFPAGTTAQATVASGLFGSMGLYRQPSEEQWQQVETRLADSHLAGYALTPFGRLSEGQQRLALLARAMVRSPRLLVLDEPCQGLAPADREQVHAALDRLVSGGGTQVLYVTHHPEDLPDCIGHLLELANGEARVAES